MKLLTYVATDESVPLTRRFVVRIMHSDGQMSPVIFEGQNLGALVEKAEDWWRAELEKAAPKVRKPKVTPVAAEPVDDIGDVL